jgi:SAM-dependent methyltransferase
MNAMTNDPLVRDLEAIKEMSRYYDWKADLIRPHLGSRVLEIGCGTGLILNRLHGPERILGIDRKAECLAIAAGRVGERPDITLREMDVQAPAFLDLAAEHVDTALFMNSLELVEDDTLALHQVFQVLAPGGTVVVFTWALETPTDDLLRHTYGIRHYRRLGLTAKLVEAGFTGVAVRYVNILGVLSWLVRRRWLEGRTMSPAEYRFHDRFTPLARVLDRLTGPPIGRVAFGVGRKPG